MASDDVCIVAARLVALTTGAPSLPVAEETAAAATGLAEAGVAATCRFANEAVDAEETAEGELACAAAAARAS
jgi:hypothetical protein